jgi:nitrate reductase assembly molybdenum cofactor insertion protein NarJ
MKNDVILEMSKAFVLSYISRTFTYPTEDLINTLIEAVDDLKACLKVINVDFDVVEIERIMKSSNVSDLQQDYENMFLLALKAPISETAYELDKTSRRAYEMADICGFYKAFGTEAQTGIEPDSLPTELEFLSILLQKKILTNDMENKQICDKAYKDFLKDHVGRWYELFCMLVNQNGTTAFYKIMANLTKKILDKETSDLKIQKLYDYKEETLIGSTWNCIK